MDRHTLGVFIPVIGMFFTGLIIFSFTSLGRAIARRIERGGTGGELEERLTRLEADNDQLRQALLDAQERLDFAEHVLSRETVAPRLPSR